MVPGSLQRPRSPPIANVPASRRVLFGAVDCVGRRGRRGDPGPGRAGVACVGPRRECRLCRHPRQRSTPRPNESESGGKSSIKRDEQLRRPTVARFVAKMEEPDEFGGRFVSMFSLMRDGRDLAERLAARRGASACE